MAPASYVGRRRSVITGFPSYSAVPKASKGAKRNVYHYIMNSLVRRAGMAEGPHAVSCMTLFQLARVQVIIIDMIEG
jgi:hypothetical protein